MENKTKNIGGLSFDKTGKHTSNRHQRAIENGKFTAGNAGKFLSKKIGVKISAKDVKDLFLHHFGHESEWHHSGFFNGKMGKTYFFTKQQLHEIAENYKPIIEQIKDEKKTEEDYNKEKILGFYYEWEASTGRYGKKTNHKVLRSFQGLRGDIIPSSFKETNKKEFKKVLKAVGKCYYGYNEPLMVEFLVRKYTKKS